MQVRKVVLGGLGREVAPDGGRPRRLLCAHLGLLVPSAVSLPARPVGRADCPSRGWSRVRLRWCVKCGHVGCCDSSWGMHVYDSEECGRCRPRLEGQVIGGSDGLVVTDEQQPVRLPGGEPVEQVAGPAAEA